MNRGYQYDFSAKIPSMYDVQSRERKAHTMIAVLSEFFKGTANLKDLTLIDIGASTGIIGNCLSGYFKQVVGVDIDLKAVSHAGKLYGKDNLSFLVGDAMKLQFQDNSFDVVICSQVYEHVPDVQKMISEIYRVLKPAGVCFFSAGNRLNLMEPHYNLPLLSVVPKPLAHLYLKLVGKGDHYYEEHLSYWGLKNLTRTFLCHDYTRKMLYDPDFYEVGYMLPPGSLKMLIAKLIANYFYWAFPNYIWILQKSRAAPNLINIYEPTPFSLTASKPEHPAP